MKRTVYTIAFIALFGAMANAQSNNPDQKPAAPASAVSVEQAEAADQPAKKQETQAAETKPATRMAITEKGVPASKAAPEQKAKATEQKKAEPAKTEKH